MGTSKTVIPRKAAVPGDEIVISHSEDRALPSVALTFFALALGHALDLKDGTYSHEALFWLTVAVAFCLLAVINPRWDALQPFCRRWLPTVLAVSIADQTYFLLLRVRSDPYITLAFATVAFLGLIQFFDLRSLRWPLMIIMVIAFGFAGGIAFNLHSKNAAIDVFMFQQNACWALTHGLNPYTFKYPSIYPPDTPFYGPGVVDAQGILTVGCPYPPLSVLLAIPGYLLGGDVRYSHLAAMGLSAGLIALTPQRRGSDRSSRSAAPLAATLLLLMPRAIYVLDLSWTEPLLVLMFSFVMFSALRWPRALPVALGLYLSTKQYTILTIPLLPLLIDSPRHWRTLWRLLLKAFLVVTAINLPFLLWNVRGFFRAIVEFQFMQSFRNDALSYLVFVREHAPHLPLPTWIALVPLAVIIPICLRRVASSPAGFAAAVTVVHLFFFAFNKQAFCNYYYFVIATACWSIAAAKLPSLGRGLAVIPVDQERPHVGHK